MWPVIFSGATALSLVYALQLAADTAQWGVRQCADVESYMTSVERVISYTEIEPEPGYENSIQPPEGWPQHGKVQMENVSLVYYSGGPQVLNDISVSIEPQQRVAIAGRTGAGKSSLVAAVFRLPEPTGRVMIDGIDIQDLNLQSSRRALSVITQSPILFTGTLRMNLDPIGKCEDGDIWQALDEAGLKGKIANLPKQLDEEVVESGLNFSVGERQLLCLARALLQRSKVMILDEATANVDYETDRLIQQTIRDKFQNCTVITIAHRLNTIMDYDKVMVMENGRLVEFDEPQALLKKEDGVFLELYRSHVRWQCND